jgi:hypothetical protein
MKRVRVNMHCDLCGKRTLHELRIIDDKDISKDSYACLICAAIPIDPQKGRSKMA